MRQGLLLVILLIGLTASVVGQDKSDKREAIQVVMDSLEFKLDWLNYKLSLEQWDLYTEGKADSLSFYQDLYAYTIGDDSLVPLFKQGEKTLESDEDLRRWKLLNGIIKRARLDEVPAIRDVRDSLQKIKIKSRPFFEGEFVSSNELREIYRFDNNRDRRIKAYRAYVEGGNELQEGLSQLFRLRTNLARKEGYNNYLSMIYDIEGIDYTEYHSLLVELEKISEQPYQNLLNRLRDKSGRTDFDVFDYYLQYQSILKSVDRYFPVDSQLVYVKRSLAAIGFDPDKLPIYYDLDSRPGKSEHAYMFPIKIPHETRILANLTNGFNSCRTLMHEIGHAVHVTQIKQDNALFRNQLEGSWAEGMANIFASMITETEWLSKYAHLPDGLIDELQGILEERELYSLRYSLVMLFFEYEAYKNPSRDLNELYWSIYERLMKLPTHPELYPWATIVHYITHPGYLQNYLYADMIAAQTVSFLKDSYGGMTDKLSTKSFLVQNYFRFGSKYHWPELLKRGIDADLDYRYYAARFLSE